MTPETLSLIGVIIGFIALVIAIATLWATVHPILGQYRDRRLLKKQFSLGPFDEYTIEQSTSNQIQTFICYNNLCIVHPRLPFLPPEPVIPT